MLSAHSSGLASVVSLAQHVVRDHVVARRRLAWLIQRHHGPFSLITISSDT